MSKIIHTPRLVKVDGHVCYRTAAQRLWHDAGIVYGEFVFKH